VAEVLYLDDRRRRLAAKRGFKSWRQRFSGSFDETTCLEDINVETLRRLIGGGEESETALYELIMGVRGMGAGLRFHFLEGTEKIGVVDVAVFLLDRLRFEAMRRLRWIDDYAGFHIPLIELIEGYGVRFSEAGHDTPALSPSHPRYGEYRRTFVGDRAVFVRRLIPDVIQSFGHAEGDPVTP
jgi:hypothetical protein